MRNVVSPPNPETHEFQLLRGIEEEIRTNTFVSYIGIEFECYIVHKYSVRMLLDEGDIKFKIEMEYLH